MIDDVLFEARCQIEWYVAHYPLRYAAVQPQIEAVCQAMAELEALLENPFFGPDDVEDRIA